MNTDEMRTLASRPSDLCSSVFICGQESSEPRFSRTRLGGHAMKTRLAARIRTLRAFHLVLYGLAVALPLLAAVYALLAHSVQQQRAQLESRVLQVAHDLLETLDRDLQRQLVILRALATSPHLQHQAWQAFYDQAKE